MGQKLREDKIGTLSHSGGSIVMTATPLNPSYLTIGGQQYRITSNLTRLIATDLTMTAMTLYMVYAAVSGGNVVMRISANVNSVGPSSFTSWKLIGAFYSNGLGSVAFGSFVNIEGSPTSEAFPFIPAISAGVGTVSSNLAYGVRNGDMFFVEGYFVTGTPTAAATSISLLGLNINPAKLNLQNTVGQNGNKVGEWATNVASQNGSILTAVGTSVGNVYISRGMTSGTQMSVTTSTSTEAISATGSGTGYTFEVPIAGWSNISLKDL